MHRQRLAVTIAAAVGMLCTFLPWAHVPLIGTIDGTAGDGWVTLVLCGLALAGCLIGDRQAAISTAMLAADVLIGLAVALIALWDLLKIADFADDRTLVRVGVGLYLLVAAGVAVAALSLLLHGSPRRRVVAVPPRPGPWSTT